MKHTDHRKQILATLVIVIVGFFAWEAHAQGGFKNISGSYIKVDGTSNLHDWTMQANNFNCEGSYVLKGDQLQDMSALNFVLTIKNLKSKDDLMDTRAYKALKAEQFPKITFKMSDAVINSTQKTIKATGNLTISGVTNQITIITNYTVNGSELVCKGTKSIKMSDFKIKAPSFMMGALKTGDNLVIDFLLKLKN